MTTGETTLVFLGDSITAAPDGYVRLVADVLCAVDPGRRLHAVNAGVGGNRSVDLPPHLERDAFSHRPDTVTLSIGINDVWRALDSPGRGLDVPLSTYREVVAAVLDAILARGACAVVLTTSVIGEDLESEGNRRLVSYNATLRELAGERGLMVAEVNGAFRRVLSAHKPPQVTTDGVHLNHQGSVMMARAVLQALGVTISTPSPQGADETPAPSATRPLTSTP